MKSTYEELEKKCALQQSKLAAINELMSFVEKASDIAKAGIEELQSQNTDLAVQLANAESKCRELAAELSAVDKIHNEAVFITDDHYEQCPPEVQKMIRSLAVLQIPVYDAFLAEVRAQGVEALVLRRKTAARIARERDDLRAADALEGEAYRAQMFADEIRQEAK